MTIATLLPTCRHGDPGAVTTGEEEEVRYGRSIMRENIGPGYRCPPPFKTYNATNLDKALHSQVPDYLAAGFISLEKAICHRADSADEEYLVELYYLKNATTAADLFQRENESQGNCPLGDNCQKGVGFVFFNDGDCYVKVIAYFPKTTPDEHVFQLAEQVQQRLRRSR